MPVERQHDAGMRACIRKSRPSAAPIKHRIAVCHSSGSTPPAAYETGRLLSALIMAAAAPGPVQRMGGAPLAFACPLLSVQAVTMQSNSAPGGAGADHGGARDQEARQRRPGRGRRGPLDAGPLLRGKRGHRSFAA
jgi:hypothetical protein